MKYYVALCLFGAFAAGLPQQDRPQVSPPIFERPAPPHFFPGMGQQHENHILDMDNPFARRHHHHQGGPAVRPTRPEFSHDGPRPSHPIVHHEISPSLHELMTDIHDFMNLIPRHQIREVIRDHVRDPELRATMKFVRTPEFHEILHTIGETAEVKAIKQYFATADWPWLQDTIAEAIHDFELQPESREWDLFTEMPVNLTFRHLFSSCQAHHRRIERTFGRHHRYLAQGSAACPVR